MAKLTKKGRMKEYVSNMVFSLNFEDHRNSVKVRKGDVVKFDGETAVYKDSSGAETSGVAPSLKVAIDMNWLSPKTASKTASKTDLQNKDPKPQSAYDNKAGGSFDEFVAREQKAGEVLKEDEMVVATHKGEESSDTEKGEKLEVALDQNAVKENLVVNSSTTTTRSSNHSTEIVQGDQFGAADSMNMKTSSQKKSPEQKKKSFTVNDTTPSLPSDASREEIARVKGVVNADESQDAKVVSTVGNREKVQEVDGVTLKHTDNASKKEMDASAKVSAGDAPSGGNQDAQVVGAVGTMHESAKTGVSAKGEKKAKKKAVKKKAVKKKTAKKKAPKKPSAKKVSTKKSATKKSSKQPTTKTETNVTEGSYLEALPDNWSGMHWTQKEKFIQKLDDVKLIEFIESLETLKAVKNACKARLEELEN